MTVKFNRLGTNSPCLQANPGVTALGSLSRWYVVFYFEVVSGSTTTDPQMVFSTANLQTGAINIGYGGPSHGRANTIHFTVGPSTVLYSAPVGALPLGWKGYVAVQRDSDASVSISWCPTLSSAPVDGSSVLLADSVFTDSAVLNGLSHAIVSVGARLDKARGCDQVLARFARGSGNISAHELARLAYGEQITDIGKTPLNYIRMDSATDITDRGSEALVLTKTGTLVDGPSAGWAYTGPATPTAPAFTSAPAIVGTPTVGAELAFTPGTVTGSPAPALSQQWTLDGVDVSGATGTTYTPVAGDIGKVPRVRQIAANGSGSANSTSAPAAAVVAAPAVGTFTVAEITRPVFQRTIGGTTAPIAMSGTYDITPTTIEAKLYGSDGTTVLQDWRLLTGTSVAGTAWSGVLLVTQGGPYRHVVRFKDASGNVIGQTSTASANWRVGAQVLILGSSSGEGWFTTGTYTARSDTFKFRNGSWGTMVGGTNGAIALLLNALAIKLGCPVAGICTAVSGTTLADWINSSGPFTNHTNVMNAVGGKVEAIMITVGSNDANENGVVSQAQHLANLNTLIARVETQLGQSNLPILLSGFNRRNSANPTQSDWVRQAEIQLGETPRITYVQTLDFELSGDLTHLNSNGYRDSMLRTIYQWPYVSGVAKRVGPKIVAFEFSGAAVVATIEHGNGTDIVPSTGATGFTVSDANGARTIQSVERVDATHLRITCDQALVAPVVTKHLSGAAPDVAAPVLDNSATPLPLSVTTLLATTQATGVTYVRADQPIAYNVRTYVRADATLSWTVASNTTPPPLMNAALVPATRWATFGGTSRSLTFNGTSRVVGFEGSSRVVIF